MKSNFSIKFKLFDVFIIAFVITCMVSTLITTNIVYGKANKKPKIVEVYINGELVKDKIVDMASLNDGETKEILIEKGTNEVSSNVKILVNKEKGIKIEEIDCPNHICTRLGWVNSVGYPITCLPNSLYVIINAKSVDFDIVLGG